MKISYRTSVLKYTYLRRRSSSFFVILYIVINYSWASVVSASSDATTLGSVTVTTVAFGSASTSMSEWLKRSFIFGKCFFHFL